MLLTIRNISSSIPFIFHAISYRIRCIYRRNIIKNIRLNIQEIDQKKTILRSTPRFMIIDPTNKCNCRCTICYRVYKKFEDSELSMENFNKLASYLKNANDVNLMGTGESFLNRNFIEMARLCKKNGAITFLSSNGMLIRNNLEVLKYIDNLNISFDGGTKETFEKIRVGAKFENVIENIKIVQSLKHKPVVRLDVRVSKQNLEELPEIVKIARDLKIKEVSFMPVCPQGTWLNNILLTEDDGLRFNKIREEVLNLEDSLGVKCTFGFSLDGHSEAVKQNEIKTINNSKSIENQKSNNVHCTAPFRMIYVEYSGKIRPCCILNTYMGDLNESSIEEIWNNQAYQSLRASMSGAGELDEFCKKCMDAQRFL